ncbi:Gfo/Idh/MocA family protein [Paenibacillus beijingensis]|uniref:Oxidoreductase n=1 Tax=Paenibacillus beijingensis TaxID=1126833 RepID=A0A0D5NPB3_9BACL|nr:Gfo/Idh/MocA family oxidoreductase [Paenibacillus beijingensis]AJY76753.1 oxidoreductase [Paenibacillus beijingensis]
MIRFGVIGTNRITDEFISAGKHIADFAVTAVYSRTAERAAEFAAKHDIAHTYSSIEEMAGSGEIDAVYIASPNSFHAQQAVICMNYGLHVLCEKPIASNMAELQSMIEAAQTNGVLLMEAMKNTYLPGLINLREHLPKIGTVRRYFASYCQYSSRYDAYKAGTVLNAFNPVFSNGALMDIGIYCLYPLIYLFGNPSRVQATGLMLESGVDGQGSILASYPDMDALIIYSKITDSHLPSEIQGEEGSIVINRINNPTAIEIRYRDGRVEDISEPADKPAMFYEIEGFMELIRSGKLQSPVNSHPNSLGSMEMMVEARKQFGLVYPADTKAEETAAN